MIRLPVKPFGFGQQGRANARCSPLLTTFGVRVSYGLALLLPIATTAYAAGPPKNPPVPLDDSGAGLPNGGVPNNAREPDDPTPAAPGLPPNPYANYRWKGLNINLPPPNGTVDQGLFGLRQKLAEEYGIGYIGFSGNTFYVNVANHVHTINGAQAYVGQKPTLLTQDFLAVTVDLSRYGIPDGQIVGAGVVTNTSWNPLGPRTVNLGTLSYYQTLFNKRIEVKAGIIANAFEFVGPFTAGSLSGGVFGPQGNIIGETGGSALQYPTLGLNVTGHITEHYYDKIGIARATSPDGPIVEHNYDPSGFSRFNVPNSGGYVINEVGYLRPAAINTPQTWVRGGGVYSNARYSELDHPGRRAGGNYAAYILGDRQLLQISAAPGEAYRGLYAGFTYEFAPANFDRFSQYYEGRLYGLGLLPGRPRDQTSLVLTNTVFSPIVVDQFGARHIPTHSNSKAATLSYSAQVIPGIYANAAIQFVDHPTAIVYTSNTGSALNLITGISLLF